MKTRFIACLLCGLAATLPVVGQALPPAAGRPERVKPPALTGGASSWPAGHRPSPATLPIHATVD
ncbi:MAG TPA: hypothetical protein VMW69_11765, partial [Spirochaetia bacterium]|nr:hypothetical protein [Spirochaetia bacterium]